MLGRLNRSLNTSNFPQVNIDANFDLKSPTLNTTLNDYPLCFQTKWYNSQNSALYREMSADPDIGQGQAPQYIKGNNKYNQRFCTLLLINY